MNNRLLLLIGIVLVIAVVAFGVGLALPTEEPAPEDPESTFAGISGPDVQSYLNVFGAFSEGGCKTTITPDNSAYTLTAVDMLACNRITFSASSTMPALTLNLPASTTIPVGGGYRSWVIENPFTGNATTTTVAPGTGINLQEPDGQNVVIGINNYGWLTCVYGIDSGAPQDYVCRLDETIPG